MESVGESRTDMNKFIPVYQKLQENASNDWMDVDPPTHENRLAEERIIECKVWGRSGEKNGSSNSSKATKKDSSDVGNKTGKISLMGMVGEGKTTIQNEEAVELGFEDVDVVGETSGNERKDRKKNSSGVGNETDKISIVGMGGKGETTIANKAPVKLTFGKIRL